MNLYEMINNHQNRLQYLFQQGYFCEVLYQELYNKFWDSLIQMGMCEYKEEFDSCGNGDIDCST